MVSLKVSSFLGSARSYASAYKYTILVAIAAILFLDVLIQVATSGPKPSREIAKAHSKEQIASVKKNVNDPMAIELRLLRAYPYGDTDPEKNIWQLWETERHSNTFIEEAKPLVTKWSEENEGYGHLCLSIEEAEVKVEQIKDTVPEVWEAYKALPHRRHKYEFLKYLLVYLYGGTYADIDVEPQIPIKDWYRPRMMFGRVFVGILGDVNEEDWNKWLNRRLTFSTSVFQSRSKHPFLAKLISRISYIALHERKKFAKIDWEKAFQDTDATGEPTISFTGPSIFSDTLIDYFNSIPNAAVHVVSKSFKSPIDHSDAFVGPPVPESQQFSYKTFSQALAPSQVENVVIYPQISFQGPLVNDEKYARYQKLFFARPHGFLPKWGYKANLGLAK
ncbi:hypothetical protein OGAPHI_004927 [Ogataea philodendri]|uniref:Mannosyltransferase n=1 Tax=Ogataea philodendri TaxID=1378263 RepID=A0A9P8T2D0_9ASCO|nr:uncharacterized protein OGAPHI_004927 [Ogataea philodendri]KAH3663526.1 hypothetical protein OGAPHI_004927 [Ogataea philodendri]